MEKALGVKSDANFFTMHVGDARETVETLKKRGILVRDCTSFDLPEYVRFSVRKPEDNGRLIEALKEAKMERKSM